LLPEQDEDEIPQIEDEEKRSWCSSGKVVPPHQFQNELREKEMSHLT
jgi:hypothetical protein